MPNRRSRRKVNPVRMFVLVALLVVVICGAFSAIFITRGLKATGNGDKKIVLTIEENESFSSLLEDMQDKGLIRSSSVAKFYSKIKHKTNYVAGTFELNDGMSLSEILSYISDASNIKQNYLTLTIPEGKWAKEIAENISTLYDGKYTQSQILKKWNDIDYIKKLASDYSFFNVSDLNNSNYKVKLEGYLFPDTYYLEKDNSIDDITRIMLDRFQQMYDENKKAFNKSDYSIHEIVSLASVVQFEASSTEDMQKIAGVFKNRLDQGMMLQSSVTVCYALYDDFNDPQDCETNSTVDSPYNTYLHTGIPIGPILNPGEEAIKAVLHPDSNDYLYFAADIYKKKDGGVYYSKTYEEHLAICEELGLNLD